MKKSLLLASVACLFAVNSQAADIKPYVSAKAKFAAVEAKAKGIAPFKRKIDDDVFGYDLAVGAGMKMETGTLRFELETMPKKSLTALKANFNPTPYSETLISISTRPPLSVRTSESGSAVRESNSAIKAKAISPTTTAPASVIRSTTTSRWASDFPSKREAEK